MKTIVFLSGLISAAVWIGIAIALTNLVEMSDTADTVTWIVAGAIAAWSLIGAIFQAAAIGQVERF